MRADESPEALPAPLPRGRRRGRLPLAGARRGIHRRVLADRLLPRAVRVDVDAGLSRGGGLLPRLPAPPQSLARRDRLRRGQARALLRDPHARHGLPLRQHHVGKLVELGPARVVLPAPGLPLRGLPLPAGRDRRPRAAGPDRRRLRPVRRRADAVSGVRRAAGHGVAPPADRHQPAGQDPHGHADAGGLLRSARRLLGALPLAALARSPHGAAPAASPGLRGSVELQGRDLDLVARARSLDGRSESVGLLGRLERGHASWRCRLRRT